MPGGNEPVRSAGQQASSQEDVRRVDNTAPTLVVGRLCDGVPELLDPTHPVVSAFDLGLVRGDGIFETLLVRHGGVRGLSAHLSRMAASARLLQLPEPNRSAWAALAAACADGWAAEVEGVLKLVMTRGLDGSPGPPTCLATLAPVPADTLRQRHAGVAVRLLSFGVASDERARSPWLLGGAKSLSYAVNKAALRHAQAAGADDVRYEVEYTIDLVNWETGVSAVQPLSFGPPTAKWRAVPLHSANPKQFLRVRATRR